MRHNRSKKAKRELRDQAAEPAAAVRVGRDHRPSSFGVSLLLGLQRKPVWTGVSAPCVVAGRRAANKAARAARRVTRTHR